jgi:hypothetical protein
VIGDVGLLPLFSIGPEVDLRFYFRSEDFSFAPDASWIGCQPYALAASLVEDAIEPSTSEKTEAL